MFGNGWKDFHESRKLSEYNEKTFLYQITGKKTFGQIYGRY